jgi:hypothetical protein
MSGFENDVMLAKNVNFNNTGPKPHLGIITAGGQLLIGSGGIPAILAGSLISPLGTLTIGYASPNITLDITGGSKAIESILLQDGSTDITPDVNGEVSFVGSTVVTGTHTSAVFFAKSAQNQTHLDIQFASSGSSSLAANSGLASFNSSQFSVDAQGYVSLVGAAVPFWSVVTAASKAMVSGNGYIANNAGTLAFTLPTTSAVGDVIAVTGINNATGWSITYTTNQQIFFGTSSSTITSGSLSSTNTRDTVTMVCVVANLVWNVISSVGNITVA